ALCHRLAERVKRATRAAARGARDNKSFRPHAAARDCTTLKKLRVRRDKKLPDVLSVDEVRRLIDAVRAHHNRAYFWTVYSLGLRLQEALHLQVGDIDSARMVVHVHRGKGAKDRFVPLPPPPLTGLRNSGSP